MLRASSIGKRAGNPILFLSQLPPSQWLAPNLVTFIGFIFVISSYAVMLCYDLSVSKELPDWVFAKAAACTFIYQTLDAVDGKQARRTKSSSPLGQLFDHGCDSFSVTFFLLAVAQACKMDQQYVREIDLPSSPPAHPRSSTSSCPCS